MQKYEYKIFKFSKLEDGNPPAKVSEYVADGWRIAHVVYESAIFQTLIFLERELEVAGK